MSGMIGVMDINAQLEAVKAELRTRRPRAVAEQCKLAYDTVLRIMRGDTSPRLDTLQTLHTYLFHGRSPNRSGQAKATPARRQRQQ